MADEGLDEFVGGVVRAGGRAVVALLKGERGRRAGNKRRGVFEQALIDGAEFLDVEGGVVDADELAGVGVFVEREGAQGVEDGAVVEAADGEQADGVGAEEVAGERGDVEFVAGAALFEEAEVGADGVPEVVVAAVGEVRAVREAADALEAVVAVVNLAFPGGDAGREDQLALLGDHEEEEAVDEAEELVVVGVGGELPRCDGLAQTVVVAVGEKAVGEAEDGAFDGGAEAIADARALVEGVLVVLLDEAGGGGGLGDGQARRVQEAEEDGEVGEEVFVEHAFEVELDETLADEARGVAEQAQGAAVGDQAVEVFGDVEIFLHEGVSRHAGRVGRKFLVLGS